MVKMKASVFGGKGKTIFIWVLILVVIAGLIGTTLFFYLQYQKLKKGTAPDDVAEITKKVSKLMELPSGETPTLATVNDKTKLTEAGFFQKAENGDKVLLFLQAEKAVLYRPSINKIIDISYIRATDQAETVSQQKASPPVPQASASPVTTTPSPVTKTATVSLLNGTTVSGLARDVETRLRSEAQFKVTQLTAAAKTDYAQTIVFDVSGSNTALATQLAKTLSATVVTTFPEGETKPDTDLVVILGTNLASP